MEHCEMTSLNLHETLKELSSSATPALAHGQSAPASVQSGPLEEPAESESGGASHIIGADDSFWVYKPKAAKPKAVTAKAAKQKLAKPNMAAPARGLRNGWTAASPAAIPPSAEKIDQTGLSLREAALLSGASKSTILRAIQSGRLAAPKTGDGSYAIDSDALLAVFPRKSNGGDAGISSQAKRAAGAAHHSDPLAARMAALEEEIAKLKTMLGEAKAPSRSWWRRLAG